MNRTILVGMAVACFGLAISGCNNPNSPPSGNAPANPSTAAAPGANPSPPAPAATAPAKPSTAAAPAMGGTAMKPPASPSTAAH
ncbi:hypothetical protein [Dyella flagellata]|uniref:hypothetical protein n=1 Tax=Dyella flagellata TaxID=1867833 RepID=UPI0024E0EB1E|nr:hypothetical protein [Dyella flagellata]